MSVGLCLRLLTYAGQAWRTESCPLCRTLSPPPPPSFHPPPHLLPLPPPHADPPCPPRIDRPAGRPPQGRGTWMRRRGRSRRRGGEALVKVEQVQPWAGGGAGYLSQGTQEGGGSEGERSNMKTLKRKIMSQSNAVFVSISTYFFSDLPVSLILALIAWTKDSKLFCR